MKKIYVIALATLLLLTACSSDAGESEKMEEELTDIVVDGETIVGYYDIIDLVGIDHDDAEKIEKIDDGNAGPRYGFQTEGISVNVYCNMDGIIDTIRIGTDIDLYKQGYEPWTIDNFLVDDGIRETLIYYTEESVTTYLNYPSTADFPLLDWSCGREFNLYAVTSYVEAQNAFGVESEMPFTTRFWVDGEQIELIYLMLDGVVLLNNSENYKLPEREKLETEEAMGENGEIRIVDGELGEYGESVTLDGWEYIWYMIPAGAYEATCNVKQCMIYVDKNEITRNSSGYVEMENVVTYELEYGETVEIVVGEDEHIFTTVSADLTLKPVN